MLNRVGRARWTTLALVVAVLALVAPWSAHAQPGGAVLVDETFRNATSAEFDAVGTACLTGAPATSTAPPGGGHPLGGCPVVAASAVPQPPTGADGLGFLQLTDASRDQAGAVLQRTPIPATKGVEISFEQWQYGSTSVPPVGGAGGADGISLFLVDGAATLDAPGAFGGSLGYAQKLPDDLPANPFLPGVSHGFLGIGLDVLGNYFGDWERRGDGCDVRSPAGQGFRVPGPGSNMVTVRGPGNDTTGYCFLTATTSNFGTTPPWPSTLPGLLRGPLATLPPAPTPQVADQLLAPSRRTVTVRVSPAPNPTVTVDVDFNDGAGARRVLSFAAPTPVPASYKLGFGGSTGLFTDVHLIRNLRVTAIDPLPGLNLVKQVSLDPPLPAVLHVGDEVRYQYTVTNSGTTDVTALTVTDDKVTDVTCGATTLAPTETTVCTGTYVVTRADVIAGLIVNVASATGTGPSGPVTSPEDTVTVPIGGQTTPNGETALSLAKTVADSAPYRPGDTAVYRYTVTNLRGVVVTDLMIVDDRLTDVRCAATTLLPAGTDGDSTTCTASYTVADADATAGTVTNRAIALGDGGQLRSNRATATIRVVRPPTTPPTTPPTGSTSGSTPEPAGGPRPSTLAATGAAPGLLSVAGLALLASGMAVRTLARRRPGR